MTYLSKHEARTNIAIFDTLAHCASLVDDKSRVLNEKLLCIVSCTFKTGSGMMLSGIELSSAMSWKRRILVQNCNLPLCELNREKIVPTNNDNHSSALREFPFIMKEYEGFGRKLPAAPVLQKLTFTSLVLLVESYEVSPHARTVPEEHAVNVV